MRKLWTLYCLLLLSTAASAQYSGDSVHVLSPAIVTPDKSKILFRSAQYEVLDYTFIGDNLLIIADKGTFKHKPVLILLSPDGDTLAYGPLHFYPQKIVKNCAGVSYVLGEDSLYRIDRDGRSLSCGPGLPPQMADLMASCQLRLHDNFYYKGGDAVKCSVSFARRSIGDTTLRRFTAIDNAVSADVVKYDMSRIRTKILFGNYPAEDLGIHYRTREELTAICYQLAAYQGFNVRNFKYLFSSCNAYQYGDSSLVITDYIHRKLRYYSDTGAAISVVPMQPQWSNANNYGFLRDDVTGRFYIHFETNSHTQYLQELQPEQGVTAGPKVIFERQFPEHVSVHNGKIYFLQHNPAGGAVRQLYVQRW